MTNSFVAQLTSFLSTNFPNFKFPPVDYECRLASGPAANAGKMYYLAKFKLLGQNICAQGPFETPEEALEASSGAALRMAGEFVRLMKSDASKLTEAEHEDLSIILKALNQEAQGGSVGKVAVDALAAVNAHLLAGQNEKIQVASKERNEALAAKFDSSSSTTAAAVNGTNGEDKSRMERLKNRLMAEIQEVKSISQSKAMEPIEAIKLTEPQSSKPIDAKPQPVKPIEPTKPSPPRDPRIPTTSATDLNSQPQPLNAQPQPRGNTQLRDQIPGKATMLPDPITIIYEYAEKSGLKKPVLFEDYRCQQFFGCCLEWNGRFWVSPADFRTKKDAHMRAALMACVELFGGEGYRFEGIDSSIYRSWTRASIRTECEKYIFATSSELLRPRRPSSQSMIEQQQQHDNQDDSSDTNSSTTGTASSNIPTTPLEPLPNGRKYLSELNQLCQKLSWPLPVFSYASVNAVNNYFVCCVRGFFDLPLMESAPFTKKSSAKEDVAGRIFLRLKERGLIEEAHRAYQEKRRALDAKANGVSRSQGGYTSHSVSHNASQSASQYAPSQYSSASSQYASSQHASSQHVSSPSLQSLPPMPLPMPAASVIPNTNAPMALMQMMSMMPLLSTMMTQASQNPANQELQVQVGGMWQQMMMLCMQGANATNVMSNGHGNGMISPSTQLGQLNQIGQMQQSTPPMSTTMPYPHPPEPSNCPRRYDSYRPEGPPQDRRDYHFDAQPNPDYDRSFEDGEIRQARVHGREREYRTRSRSQSSARGEKRSRRY